MTKTLKLIKHELCEYLKNPAILSVVLLPIFMSKVIGFAMKDAGIEFLMLSVWILFAQVMVGIMLTGPNLIEEREGKTMDALLCSPLNFSQIIIAKGITILIFSMISQVAVYLINRGFDMGFVRVLFPMILGGVVFIEIGAIIGLKIQSSKNGSAVSAVVMVLLFLIVSVYPSLPKWTYKFFLLLPSVDVSEVMTDLIDTGKVLWTEVFFGLGWLVLLTILLIIIGKRITK